MITITLRCAEHSSRRLRPPTADPPPLGLAVDAANVYVVSDQWLDPTTFQPTDGQLLAVSRTTGEMTSLAVTHGASAIATDGVRVYWTEEQPPAVKAIPVGGGAIVTLWSGSDAHTPNGIALDDTYATQWLRRRSSNSHRKETGRDPKRRLRTLRRGRSWACRRNALVLSSIRKVRIASL